MVILIVNYLWNMAKWK